MLENEKQQEPETLGKYELIKRLGSRFTLKNSSSHASVGNDVAVITPQKNTMVVASKLIMENIHFDLTYFPLKHLGYKAVTLAVSDLLGMNATPSQITIQLAISNRFSWEALDEFFIGMQRCCDRYQIDVVDIDIISSLTGLCISISAIGEVDKEQLTARDQAQEHDLICVSGDLGAAYTGLVILEREKKVFEVNPDKQPDFDGVDYLLERQLKPEPRVDVLHNLEKCGIVPHAMINVSEGLATALLHICHASKLGCEVYEEKIPIDAVAFETLKELNIVATTIALNGGEDYELLFTIPQSDYEKVCKMENISVIGYMQESAAGCHLITNDRCSIELQAQGFSGK